MIIRVLGAAAGGGFPQWNCGCPNCRGVREAGSRARARSQECVAVSADGDAWLLLNCSPEIRAQIESFPPLHPRAPRHSPIAAILLTNGDLDHCLGLLSLRESHPLVLYATEAVRRGFVEGNVLYRTLERFPGQATWRTLKLGREDDVADTAERAIGLTVEPLAAPGKPPIHLEPTAPDPEHNVGVWQRHYVNTEAELTVSIFDGVRFAHFRMFDGTTFGSIDDVLNHRGSIRCPEITHQTPQ